MRLVVIFVAVPVRHMSVLAGPRMGETTDKRGQRPHKPATSTFTYASAEDESSPALRKAWRADGLSGGGHRADGSREYGFTVTDLRSASSLAVRVCSALTSSTWRRVRSGHNSVACAVRPCL